jgi:hypothetical protein
MMTLEEQIGLNQFAQSVRPIGDLLTTFTNFTENRKRMLLLQLCDLIWQSKPIDVDIELAIQYSALKPTFTPCVLLRTHRLILGLPKVLNLPNDELKKAYTLLLNLFKTAYLRRFDYEKGHTGKWWYADLSDKKLVESLLNGKDYP